MGDFNVSCVMSGISMCCDKAVLFPLIRPRFNREDGIGFDTAYFISNEGATGIYEFLTFPIFGELNGYGAFEKIEKNENTKLIEKYFGVNIQDFARNIAYAEGSLKKLDRNIITGTYMHREIFNKFSTSEVDEFGKENYSALSMELVDSAVNLIGFTFEKVDEKRDRYNRLLTNPRFPHVHLWSDGHWCNIEINKKKHESVYHLIDLIELINKNSKKRKFSVKEIEKIGKIPAENLRIMEVVKKAREQTETLNHLKSEDKEFFLGMRIGMGIGGVYGDFFGTHSGFSEEFQKIYGQKLLDGTFDDLIAATRVIRHNMFAVNRLFLPTFNGYQYGNHYASKALYDFSSQIVDAKIKEYEDNDK